jgi:hypothetical protein
MKSRRIRWMDYMQHMRNKTKTYSLGGSAWRKEVTWHSLLDVRGIILKWILNKQDGMVWSGLIGLRREISFSDF